MMPRDQIGQNPSVLAELSNCVYRASSGMINATGRTFDMSFSIIASAAAGPALSYGLGQGATLVGAVWGVFIWKEFDGAPPGTKRLLAAMFVLYVIGLGVLIASKT